MLWSQLQPTLSLQIAAIGLGPPPNCTALGHCSTKGIGSLHNVSRQKCEWVRGAGELQVGLGGSTWDAEVLDMGLESRRGAGLGDVGAGAQGWG